MRAGVNQVKGEISPTIDDKATKFKRIVNVWAIRVKPSWDAVMATLLEYRRDNILRESFDRPCSTTHKTTPEGAPD